MSSVHKLLAKKGNHVYRISEQATVLEAARMMNEHRIGALVVMNAERLVGIFTERDILCRVVAEQRDPAKTTVEQVMTSPVACCTPQTTRDECRAVMRERRLRHLPVVDDGRLVGMISIGDLNDAEQADQEQTIQYLTEYVLGDWK
jgi:CBS domain-containing protein